MHRTVTATESAMGHRAPTPRGACEQRSDTANLCTTASSPPKCSPEKFCLGDHGFLLSSSHTGPHLRRADARIANSLGFGRRGRWETAEKKAPTPTLTPTPMHGAMPPSEKETGKSPCSV